MQRGSAARKGIHSRESANKRYWISRNLGLKVVFPRHHSLGLFFRDAAGVQLVLPHFFLPIDRGMPSMPPRSVMPSAGLELFAARPDLVKTLAIAARQLLLASLPGAVEIPDAKASVVGYGFGSGYNDMVATLILSKTAVKIGLVQGASLPDPNSLLEGSGKVHRYIVVTTQEQLRRPEIRQLIEAGVSASRQRSKST
jgi:hypothetical protein